MASEPSRCMTCRRPRLKDVASRCSAPSRASARPLAAFEADSPCCGYLGGARVRARGLGRALALTLLPDSGAQAQNCILPDNTSVVNLPGVGASPLILAPKLSGRCKAMLRLPRRQAKAGLSPKPETSAGGRKSTVQGSSGSVMAFRPLEGRVLTVTARSARVWDAEGGAA